MLNNIKNEIVLSLSNLTRYLFLNSDGLQPDVSIFLLKMSMLIICSTILSFSLLVLSTYITKTKMLDILVFFWNFFFVLLVIKKNYDTALYLFVGSYLIVDIGVNVTCIIYGIITNDVVSHLLKFLGVTLMTFPYITYIFNTNAHLITEDKNFLGLWTDMIVIVYTFFIFWNFIGYIYCYRRQCFRSFLCMCLFFIVLVAGFYFDR